MLVTSNSSPPPPIPTTEPDATSISENQSSSLSWINDPISQIDTLINDTLSNNSNQLKGETAIFNFINNSTRISDHYKQLFQKNPSLIDKCPSLNDPNAPKPNPGQLVQYICFVQSKYQPGCAYPYYTIETSADNTKIPLKNFCCGLYRFNLPDLPNINPALYVSKLPPDQPFYTPKQCSDHFISEIPSFYKHPTQKSTLPPIQCIPIETTPMILTPIPGLSPWVDQFNTSSTPVLATFYGKSGSSIQLHSLIHCFGIYSDPLPQQPQIKSKYNVFESFEDQMDPVFPSIPQINVICSFQLSNTFCPSLTKPLWYFKNHSPHGSHGSNNNGTISKSNKNTQKSLDHLLQVLQLNEKDSQTHQNDTTEKVFLAPFPTLKRDLVFESWKHIIDAPPLLEENLVQLRNQCIELLSTCFAGDKLAAEYLLFSLGSKLSHRVYDMTVGMIQTNFSGFPLEDSPQQSLNPLQVKKIVSCLVSRSIWLPFDPLHLKNTQLVPFFNSKTQNLEPSILQCSHGTVLMIDETVLKPGMFNSDTLYQLGGLQQLITSNILGLNYSNYNINFPLTVPCISLSYGPSILQGFEFHIKVVPPKPKSPLSTFESLLEKNPKSWLSTLRAYLSLFGSFEFSIPSSLGVEIQSDWVNLRAKYATHPQLNSRFGSDSFHRLLNLVRIYCQSLGHTECTLQDWKYVSNLEIRRILRYTPPSTKNQSTLFGKPNSFGNHHLGHS